jgi:hypothetical protein
MRLQELWCFYKGEPIIIPMPCRNQYFVEVFSEEGRPIYDFGCIKGEDTLTLFNGLSYGLVERPSINTLPFGKYLIVISHV